MKFLVVFLSLVSISLGCATSTKLSSEWSGLDSAQKVSCEAWPLPDGTLSANQIYPLWGSKAGFIANYTMRNGSAGTFYFPFAGDEEIKADSGEARKFGGGSMVAGGGSVGSTVFVGVIQTSKGTRFELRTAADNVVRFISPINAKHVRNPNVEFSGKNVWLTFNEADEETAVEDAKVSFVHFQIDDKAKKLVLKKHYASFPNGSKVIPMKNSDVDAVAIWGNKTSNEAKSFKFYVQGLKPKNATVAGKELEISIESAMESWSVQPTGDGFLLAIIDGDSLVGQSMLRIARVNWQDGYQRVSWMKSRTLMNEHVSDGFWFNQSGKQHFALPRWLDNESTLGLYTVSGSGIDNVRALGVYATGLRLMGVSDGLKGSESFALIRTKERGSVGYKLCNLGEL